jgi:hypothetical protein
LFPAAYAAGRAKPLTGAAACRLSCTGKMKLKENGAKSVPECNDISMLPESLKINAIRSGERLKISGSRVMLDGSI